MKNKPQIHQFEPTIYPRKLWVIKGVNALSVIQDNFTEVNCDEIRFDKEFKLGFEALTMKVMQKETNFLGVLVWLRCKTNISIIAHESVHFAGFVFNDCGITMSLACDENEHFAYLFGFCADCINQVATNKIK